MARMNDAKITAVRSNLRAALPEGHPVAKEADGVIQEMWEELGNADVALRVASENTVKAETTVATHEKLMDVLADWRRGIRDWSEVEDALKRAGLAKERQDADNGGPKE